MDELTFTEGQPVFAAGDPADAVYRVRAGSVRAVPPGADGGASALRFGPGDIVGDAGVLTGAARPFTAIAEGDVTVDMLRRSDLLARLSEDPERFAALLAALFGPMRPVAPPPDDPPPDGGQSVTDEPPAAAGEPAPVVLSGEMPRVVLVPDGKRVRAIVGTDEIVVGRLPFSVGRAVSGEGTDSYGDVALALDDRRPFSLSRRHFTIDREDGGLVVRDNGSYHGTMVNGLLLSTQRQRHTAPLMTGENEVVAGPQDSPFRFRVLIG